MNHSGAKRPYSLVAAVIIVAAVAGLLVGNIISARLDARARENERLAQIDEYQGLAQRSGITGDLVLDVDPPTQTVKPGGSVKCTVRLTNRSKRTMRLNSWIEPYPAMLGSNQIPLKVDIRMRRQPVTYHGDSIVLPPHTNEDFFMLRPGQGKSTTIDLSKPAGRGRWDFSTPGTYEVALWYETYLSGNWIGVKAWTGRTNPYVVQVVVGP